MATPRVSTLLHPSQPGPGPSCEAGPLRRAGPEWTCSGQRRPLSTAYGPQSLPLSLGAPDRRWVVGAGHAPPYSSRLPRALQTQPKGLLPILRAAKLVPHPCKGPLGRKGPKSGCCFRPHEHVSTCVHAHAHAGMCTYVWGHGAPTVPSHLPSCVAEDPGGLVHRSAPWVPWALRAGTPQRYLHLSLCLPGPLHHTSTLTSCRRASPAPGPALTCAGGTGDRHPLRVHRLSGHQAGAWGGHPLTPGLPAGPCG